MKITEVVQHVERNKLPRDPEWLRKRIFHLISLLWFHYGYIKKYCADIGMMPHNDRVPSMYELSMKDTEFDVSIKPHHPVFQDDLTAILHNLQDPNAPSKYRPRRLWIVDVPLNFPKFERVKYHVQSYHHAQEDLERTVRSAARLMKS